MYTVSGHGYIVLETSDRIYYKKTKSTSNNDVSNFIYIFPI